MLATSLLFNFEIGQIVGLHYAKRAKSFWFVPDIVDFVKSTYA